MLSEIARLMFFRFKSNEMNITHAQSVIFQSSYIMLVTSRTAAASAYLANEFLLLFCSPGMVRIESVPPLVLGRVVYFAPVLRRNLIFEHMVIVCWIL